MWYERVKVNKFINPGLRIYLLRGFPRAECSGAAPTTLYVLVFIIISLWYGQWNVHMNVKAFDLSLK